MMRRRGPAASGPAAGPLPAVLLLAVGTAAGAAAAVPMWTWVQRKREHHAADTCQHCGCRGCHPDTAQMPDHKPDCPHVTDIWPVTEEDAGLECGACEAELRVGNFYSFHETTTPNRRVAVCLLCAATAVGPLEL